MMLRRGERRIISTSTKKEDWKFKRFTYCFIIRPFPSLPLIMGSAALLFVGLIRDIKERENINRR